MNDTLSSLLAFVGFLIVFSLLIQSIQEALKNLFKLKTGVWERFFLDLYKTDFKMEKILPETPFWERVKSAPFVGEFEERLKRLKTIILKTDDFFKEIKTTLVEFTGMDLSSPDNRKNALLKIELLSEQIDRISDLKIEPMLELYDKNKDRVITELLKNVEGFCEIFEDIENKNLTEIQTKCKDLYRVTQKLAAHISAYRAQIENKADAWMVQLQGEYKKNMLKWTLIISIFSVVLMNADSFTVYEYFSVNSKAQGLMIANAASAISDVNKLRAEDLNDINEAIKNNNFEKARTGILGFSKQLAGEFETLNDSVNKTRADTLLNETKEIDPESLTDSNVLKDQQGKLIRLYVTLQKSSVNFQMEGLSATGLPLGWRSDWNTIWNSECGISGILIVKKVLGLILTIFLVSFGAPFWQNIMNALIGLKNVYRKSESEFA